MTSTSKSAQVRDVAVSTGGIALKGARLFSMGYAGIGYQLAKRGYGLAHRESESRAARRGSTKTGTSTGRTRRFLVFGAVFGVAAGVAVLATRRRREFVPAADAPPRLSDYEDTPTPVNGSSAQHAEQ
ncbi:MAG: hypothetical protein WBQ44_03860 [Rhodococcus sp. (in: high G+C Gram-positive bacteria)]